MTKHFHSKKLTTAQIKVELDEVHKDTALTLKTVYFWAEKGEGRFIAGKVMATVFWDPQRIILIDYLRKGQTITEEYFLTRLIRLLEKLRTERPVLAHKKIVFHQDNAPVHTTGVSIAKVHELGFKLLPHPLYFPDLAPSDFFLFPNLKISLGGKRFSSDEVIAAVDKYFKGFKTSYFFEGIKKLEERWTKCVDI